MTLTERMQNKATVQRQGMFVCWHHGALRPAYAWWRNALRKWSLPRVPDEAQQIAVALQQLPISGPSPSWLAIIIENGVVPPKTSSTARIRHRDTNDSLVIMPSFGMWTYMYKSIDDPKVFKPYPDSLLFTETRDGHAFPRHPPDHTCILDRATASMCISLELQHDYTRVACQSMDGMLFVPVMQQLR